MIAGTVVNIGGTDYMVPPFNIAMWERPEFNTEQPADGAPDTPVALLRRLGPALLDNLARNYPQIDRDAIMADLDLPTLLELKAAAMAVRHEPVNPPSAPV